MKKFYSILLIMCIVLTVVGCGKKKESDEWPQSGLGAMISPPLEGIVDIHVDTSSEFWVDIEPDDDKVSDIYNSMVEDARAKGFTVDAKSESQSFIAFTNDGHKILMDCYFEKISVYIYAPIQMSSFTWPNSKGAEQLPRPISTVGKITQESENAFSLYVGETSMDAFNAYVGELMARGYDQDYNKSDGWYHGENVSGDSINAQYYGFNIMYLHYNVNTETEKADDTAEINEQLTEAATDDAISENEEIDDEFVPNESTSDGNEDSEKSSTVNIFAKIKEGMSVGKVLDYLNEIGYKATFIADNTKMDFTETISDMPEMADMFEVKRVEDVDDSKKTMTIYILGAETIKENEEKEKNQKALEEKLDIDVAWGTTETYGKKMYGDSFKIKYLTIMAETPEDEDTWFLKANCTYKLNGNTFEKTCESRVTGSTDAPEVVSFNVY